MEECHQCPVSHLHVYQPRKWSSKWTTQFSTSAVSLPIASLKWAEEQQC